MSFSVKDSALKRVPYHPVACTVPCVGHTLQRDLAAPRYGAGVPRRDDDDGSRGVRRLCGTCVGRRKPREDSVHLPTARTDTFQAKDLIKRHSCKFHSSTPPRILISSLRGDLQHDYFRWLSLYCTNTLFQYTQPGIIHSTQLTRTTPRRSAGAILKWRANKLSILKVFYCWALLFLSNTCWLIFLRPFHVLFNLTTSTPFQKTLPILMLVL